MATPIGPSDQECTLTMTRKKELSELCHPTKNKQTKVTDLTTIIIIFMGNTILQCPCYIQYVTCNYHSNNSKLCILTCN